MTSMQTTVTIPKSMTGSEDLIVLPLREYEELQSRVLPLITLKGKAASRVDRRVRAGLRDAHEGKTESIETFLKRDFPHLYSAYAR